ncbi:MAG: phosphocholine cytidylyltransferase family protein [Pirellulaceae bacterium]|nr:phosphocholine cytidylyltransferase family protein [Pirellulaceae bacterium]
MSLKLIVLAAGQGTRLRPLTDDRPKCMVDLQGTPILEHQLKAARSLGITDVHAVVGYRHDRIPFTDITKHVNAAYATTNMVSSLFTAESELSGDVIVSYGDIVFQPEVLQKLIDFQAPVSVVVDQGWREYWEARMEDPLSDAETMKLHSDGTILELGKKPKSYDEVQGQYIGLIKFAAAALPKILDFYHLLDRNQTYDGKNFDNMYMTSFLQLIIDRLMPVHAVTTLNGWMEVDCPDDLKHTQFLNVSR